MAEKLPDWERAADGTIKVYPVMGWQTATFMKGMAAGIRLEYSTELTLGRGPCSLVGRAG